MGAAGNSKNWCGTGRTTRGRKVMIPDSQKLDGLLLMLRGRGVQLWVEDGELHYRGSADALTPDLVSRLRQQKLAIIEFLKKAELTKMAENHHSLFRSKHLDQLPL